MPSFWQFLELQDLASGRAGFSVGSQIRAPACLFMAHGHGFCPSLRFKEACAQ